MTHQQDTGQYSLNGQAVMSAQEQQYTYDRAVVKITSVVRGDVILQGVKWTQSSEQLGGVLKLTPRSSVLLAHF